MDKPLFFRELLLSPEIRSWEYVGDFYLFFEILDLVFILVGFDFSALTGLNWGTLRYVFATDLALLLFILSRSKTVLSIKI